MPHHAERPIRGVPRRVRRTGSMRRAAWQSGVSPATPRDPSAPSSEVVRTTADATIRPVAGTGYRRMDWAPGEPHLLLTDLGAVPSGDRVARRRSLLYFAHHTDTHVCDAQSPARLEGGETFGWVNPGADAGHRPQEACTTQVLDQLVIATNAVTTSPLSGAPMAWCIQTGDNTDNRTAAELRWWVDILDGRPVTPNTGAEGRYEGVQRSRWRGVWQPDRAGWDRRSRAGFPYLPGFLDAAVAPFDPVGLGVGWLAVFGNHDSIFQGTFGPNRGPRIDLLEKMLRSSSRKPLGPFGLGRALAQVSTVGPSTERWERRRGNRHLALRVTPDPDARRSVTIEEYVAALLASGEDPTAPGPAGHGFSPAHLSDGTTWWSRPAAGGRIQLIGLDSCNHTHGDGGSLGPRQAAWFEAELQACHTRWRDGRGGWVEGPGPDRLVIIASHHNTWTMDNPVEDEADPGPRLLGPELVEMVERYPNVVLWFNGHSHEHRIVGHRRAGEDTGWWEVNTASNIDFGQQGRTIELFDNRDGTLSIVATVLDHAAPPRVAHRRDGRFEPSEIASISRELSVNDDQWFDPLINLGRIEDRNVELAVAAPFPLD